MNSECGSLASFRQSFVDENLHIHATIQLAPLGVGVLSGRMSRPVARWCEDSPHRNILLVAEILHHGRRAVCAELLIELFGARAGGIARNFDHVSLETLRGSSNDVKVRFRSIVQSRFIAGEIDSGFNYGPVFVHVRNALVYHLNGSRVHDRHITRSGSSVASLIGGRLSLIGGGLRLISRGLSLARRSYALG